MSIPNELIDKNQWVGFRLVPGEDDEKPRKIPVDPKTCKNARSNDPNTWSDYETAVSAAEKYGFTGIGFMFQKSGGLVGVDIDHCYDKSTGTFNETAAAILKRQNTYAEFSPSGEGIHLWFRGEKPPGSSRNNETGVEMYDSARYFTVTGNALPGASPCIADALPGTLPWIWSSFIAKTPKKETPALSDEEVLKNAKNSADSEDFMTLYEGNWQEQYPSQSEADLALCRMLLIFCGKDRLQADRLFRSSGLFRPKWDEKHHADGSTYGEQTLNVALESLPDDAFEPKIFEQDGCYMLRKGGRAYPLTNFILHPLEMILGEDETQLTADFETTRGESFRLSFLTTDFANRIRFKNLLNGKTIALSYFGGEGDLELLKTYVSSLDWPKKTGVKAAGIVEHEGRLVYVSEEGTADASGSPVEGLVQLEKYRSIQSGILSAPLPSAEGIRSVGSYILSYNEPEKTVSILAWIAGCFLKPQLRRMKVKFPHLFLIGEAGSGKSTTLERVILPVFSTGRITAATQVTPFTLMKESASSNLIPMPLDEFKPSKMDRMKINALYNHFRDAYDGHEGVRGRADQSVLLYELLAPMVVAGEESADETAIRERSMELLFSKKDIKNPKYRPSLKRVSSGSSELQSFGRMLLGASLSVVPETARAWYDEGMQRFSKDLPARVRSNLSCCYAGLKLLNAACASFSLSWEDVFPLSFECCVRWLEMAVRDYLLDGGTHNLSIVEQAFETMARMQLCPGSDYLLSDDGKILYLRLSQVYDRFTKYRRDYAVAGEVLPYAQFRKQLEHSDILLQPNAQKKFGNENVRCWVINLEELSSRCDVSGFEVSSVTPL